MGKILAIDFGLKRTGLALSDTSKKFAFGFKTLESRELLNQIIPIIDLEKIETIVLGLPKKLNLEDSHITQNVHLFKEALEKKTTVPIIFFDERFTSKMAFQSMIDGGLSAKKRQDKALIDEISATLLLQSYISFLEARVRE